MTILRRAYRSISKINLRRFTVAAFAWAFVTILVLFATRSAQAQTYSVLLSFKNMSTGRWPLAGLVLDKTGNLYGTTSYGGTHTQGTVFKLTTAGKETVLYSFAGYNDVSMQNRLYTTLIRDAAGNLYGTGGNSQGGCAGCPGAIFELTHVTGGPWTETVMHLFDGADGAHPTALIRNSSGDLYGTTFDDGAHNAGTVFKLDSTGQLTTLHNFEESTEGRGPLALVRDSSGNLYGATNMGGSFGHGTVFKLSAAGKLTILYRFTGAADGGLPNPGMVRDKSGDLYGTTAYGGNGSGTVFKLALGSNGKWTETVLYSFCAMVNCTDGGGPLAGVFRDAAGNLYGTTSGGGASGLGTVFKLDATGTETVLHSFTGPDGKSPYAGVVQDSAGNLYGTTYLGGAYGYGVVFKITPE